MKPDRSSNNLDMKVSELNNLDTKVSELNNHNTKDRKDLHNIILPQLIENQLSHILLENPLSTEVKIQLIFLEENPSSTKKNTLPQQK